MTATAKGHTRVLNILPMVALISFTLGVLTAYAQGWLAESVGSLANSTGTWALTAFVLATLAPSRYIAALSGFIALIMLLAGYAVASELRGFAVGTSMLLFWGAAAVVAGPLEGLAAHWVRFERSLLGAFGGGLVSGVLIGEGIYGLLYISDTTYPPYWWGQIAVGLLLLGVIAARQLRKARTILLAAVIAAATAGLFVVVYSRASSILGILS